MSQDTADRPQDLSRDDTRPGPQIIPEHRPGTHLFSLYDGWAMRYKTLSDGRRATGDGSIVFPFTQQHLADALGLHAIRNGRRRRVDLRGLENPVDRYRRPRRNVPLIQAEGTSRPHLACAVFCYLIDS